MRRVTKWNGDKSKEFTDDYKLYYTGQNSAKNRVDIVVDKGLKEKIVWVNRFGVKHVAIKLML